MILIEKPHAISLHDITYVVCQGNRQVTILDNISVTWHHSCLVALRGVSGSGKSTLLSIIAGLLYPTSGTVTFGSHQLDHTNEALWRIIRSQYLGYVFQAPLLISELSVLENVMTRALIDGGCSAEREQEAYELLHDLGIATVAHTRPSSLSGGEQQRVSLARALFGRPAFIVMDEPTAHLDTTTRERFLELINKIQSRTSIGIIIATHDAVISDTMSEVWNINQGKLERVR